MEQDQRLKKALIEQAIAKANAEGNTEGNPFEAGGTFGKGIAATVQRYQESKIPPVGKEDKPNSFHTPAYARPIEEGEVRSGSRGSYDGYKAPTMQGQYEYAAKMKQEQGDYPSGAMGKALEQMEQENQDPEAQTPAAKEAKFIRLRNFWLEQGK